MSLQTSLTIQGLTATDLQSSAPSRSFPLGRFSSTCGLCRMRRNLSLCLISTRKATSCSNRAKFRKPQKNTTTALLASKIYRWRSVGSQSLCSDILVSLFHDKMTQHLFFAPTWLSGPLAGASSWWSLGETGPHDHTAAPQLLPVPAAPGPVLWSDWTLLLSALQIWRWGLGRRHTSRDLCCRLCVVITLVDCLGFLLAIHFSDISWGVCFLCRLDMQTAQWNLQTSDLLGWSELSQHTLHT